MKKVLFGLLVVGAMALPATASAHRGPPVVNSTESFSGAATIAFVGPCGGAPGQATIDFHETTHVTDFGDGHFVVASVQTGTFVFEPDDPTAPSASGHYTNRFRNRGASNSEGFNSVFTIVGRWDDGAKLRIQVRENYVFANGELRVESFEVVC